MKTIKDVKDVNRTKCNYKGRFKDSNKFVENLIRAEEAYLIVCHWNVAKVDGVFSSWKNSEYDCVFTRNQAITICKFGDQNIGGA